MNNYPQGARDVKPNKPPRGDMTDPLSIITDRVLAPLRHLVTPDATLDELRLDPIDRLSIANDMDEAFGVELRDATVNRWQTVGDVIDSVREMADV